MNSKQRRRVIREFKSELQRLRAVARLTGKRVDIPYANPERTITFPRNNTTAQILEYRNALVLRDLQDGRLSRRSLFIAFDYVLDDQVDAARYWGKADGTPGRLLEARGVHSGRLRHK